MNLNYMTAAVLIAIVLTSCVDRSPAPATQAEPAAETSGGGTTTAESELRELMTTLEAASAFPLAPGSYISGSITAPDLRNSVITVVAVQIGNYASTADGAISLELCQESRCANGRSPLEGSSDNGYLEIALEEAFNVSTNSPLTYRFTKLEGAGPVAIWLYKPTDAVTAVVVNGEATLELAPRIAVRL